MTGVTLLRNDALDLLVAIEEAVHHLLLERVYALAIALEDGATLLIDKLYPDLPAGG